MPVRCIPPQGSSRRASIGATPLASPTPSLALGAWSNSNVGGSASQGSGNLPEGFGGGGAFARGRKQHGSQLALDQMASLPSPVGSFISAGGAFARGRKQHGSQQALDQMASSPSPTGLHPDCIGRGSLRFSSKQHESQLALDQMASSQSPVGIHADPVASRPLGFNHKQHGSQLALHQLSGSLSSHASPANTGTLDRETSFDALVKEPSPPLSSVVLLRQTTWPSFQNHSAAAVTHPMGRTTTAAMDVRPSAFTLGALVADRTVFQRGGSSDGSLTSSSSTALISSGSMGGRGQHQHGSSAALVSPFLLLLSGPLPPTPSPSSHLHDPAALPAYSHHIGAWRQELLYSHSALYRDHALYTP